MLGRLFEITDVALLAQSISSALKRFRRNNTVANETLPVLFRPKAGKPKALVSELDWGSAQR
jgi:hypothetical protein